MRSGNSLLSSNLPTKDALIIIRGMLGAPETSMRGIIDGIKYIRIHYRQHAGEAQFQTLAELVCVASVSVVADSISDSLPNERISWVAHQLRSFLNAVDQKQLFPTDLFLQLRCQSSFNLAEIFRQKKRLRSSISLLRESEDCKLAEIELGGELSDSPSLHAIRTHLAEMLLLIGDAPSSLDKSGEVIASFRERSDISTTEKVQVAYALFLFVKASIRLGRLQDHANQARDLMTQLRRDLSAEDDSHLVKLLDQIDCEMCRPIVREPTPFSTQKSQQPPSRGRSEPPGTSRRRQGAVESHTVYIPPQTQSVSISCQTGVDEEAVEFPERSSSQRSQSVPSTVEGGKKFIQSPNVTSGHEVDIIQGKSEPSTSVGADDIQWVECLSRNSGKQYWYNTITGESAWGRT